MTFHSLDLTGARVLFAASTGGHLTELSRLAPLIGASPDSALVTFESEQSLSTRWVDDVRFVPYVKPRDILGTARAARHFRRFVKNERWDAVVSTGAAIAVAALPVAAALGTRSIYVESYARFNGPSATGRILAKLPGDYEFYTQHESWADDRWRYTGSVIDAVVSNPRPPAEQSKKVFVTLGTIDPYRFDSLVNAVLNVGLPDTEFVWQLGCTDRQDLPGQTYRHLDQPHFDAIARDARMVISHAGVGTALELIEMGHKPLLVPRRATRGEHVDDHQLEIAQDLSQRGLALTCDVSELAGVIGAATV